MLLFSTFLITTMTLVSQTKAWATSINIVCVDGCFDIIRILDKTNFYDTKSEQEKQSELLKVCSSFSQEQLDRAAENCCLGEYVDICNEQ